MAMNVGSGNGIRSKDPDVMIDINTTPLIDVMLVLLVMLIITLPIQLHSVNLNMPTGNPPPPPPPPKKIIEPPKVQVQQPYVPPPDIPPPVAPAEPVIAQVAPTPPPEPVAIAPPVVEAPPAPPPKPAIRQGVSCGRMEKPSFPREAIKAGVQKGQVHAVLTIDEKGNVADVKITQAEPARVFDRVVRETLTDWKCAADGTKYQASVEINFTLKDE